MKPRFEGTEKECIKCHNIFPMENFYMAKETKIYSARCKQCDLTYHKIRFGTSYKTRSVTLFNGAKSRSKRRNILFNITKTDIIQQYEKQNGKCYYSGRPLSSVAGNENVMSIDRINSSIGYTPENIVICCWRINKMKNVFSTGDFVTLCKEISSFSDNRHF